jgi:hypothetical protein
MDGATRSASSPELHQPSSDFLRASCYRLENVRSWFINQRDRVCDPQASSFFDALNAGGFRANAHIDVLERQRLIYIAVPKCASTTIKSVLSTLNETVTRARPHQRRYSGLKSPRLVGLSAFHRLATSPDTMRFAFVRNPYARLVSAWADKFSDKPLVPGDSFVDDYLAWHGAIDAALPHGPDKTLSFAQFVVFATATARRRVDAHWQLQADLVAMPGIPLDFIGKVELFHHDFTRVLDHVDADRDLNAAIALRLNTTRHSPWPDYYSADLASRVYRAYEPDFDAFAYARAPNLAAA